MKKQNWQAVDHSCVLSRHSLQHPSPTNINQDLDTRQETYLELKSKHEQSRNLLYSKTEEVNCLENQLLDLKHTLQIKELNSDQIRKEFISSYAPMKKINNELNTLKNSKEK